MMLACMMPVAVTWEVTVNVFAQLFTLMLKNVTASESIFIGDLKVFAVRYLC